MEHIKESKNEMMLVIDQRSMGFRQWVCCLLLIGFISSCSVSKQIGKQANTVLLNDTAISTGHIGISIYEPATDKYWYNYNATKYFIPASNTKLFTLYAGMKYLGDSLVGLRYTENNTALIDSIPQITNLVKIFPSGDPTFLNTEFPFQPAFKFLKKQNNIEFCDFNNIEPLSKGWAWGDYMEEYMTPRNSFPMYQNIIDIKFIRKDSVLIKPKYFEKEVSFVRTSDSGFFIYKDFLSNKMRVTPGRNQVRRIPFYPTAIAEILQDTLKQQSVGNSSWIMKSEDLKTEYKTIHSQPSDSLFKPMMHRSDNFFAEQTLLMASNEHLGYMSDEKIIDTLLKTDLKDVPQKPKWVDGSGLSRYNLFTPQSFVYILNKTKNEFGWDRLKNILPTGGTGTLSAYFKKDSGFIYAKTGTLSNNCALSGFLVTKKGKLLIFSILANNYMGAATPVRKATEKFLLGIRENY